MQTTEQLFKRQFNAVKKLITFSRFWIGDAGSVRRMVVDQDNRLMLEHGEWCKTIDELGKHYLMVGTPFGIIVLQQRDMLGKAFYWFETTRALVSQFPTIATDRVTPSGFIMDTFMNSLIDGSFLDDVEARGELIAFEGGAVGDGIPIRKIHQAKPGKRAGKEELARVRAKQKTKQVKQQRAKVPDDAVAPKKTRPKQDYVPKVTRRKPPKARGQLSSIQFLDEAAFYPATVITLPEPYLTVQEPA